ncbi:Cytochrome b-c1 complex subunit 2, mitochondrial [Chionoecetes opilio]|uniref:Cytochrome b-c1 complex subunit 2, mitochondrial n=1 Tax=Chionoecetes opilio TaxID=41210 RepID=A0A8J4XXT8_CHIOP|nr:Cytochrome b-c1 complex subunit 2, mitochondrial [Chionoecetes opilio]
MKGCSDRLGYAIAQLIVLLCHILYPPIHRLYRYPNRVFVFIGEARLWSPGRRPADHLHPAPAPAQVTSLPSGVVVASQENNSPVSRVAVLFKAGSRYESPSQHGASHMVRSCVGQATANTTAFSIIRSLQQVGGSIEAEGGREHILYGLEVIRDNLDSALEVLGEVSTKPAYKAWELKDSLGRVKTELALREPSALALEMLHKAAFRNTGLANSIFVPDHKVGKLSGAVLHDYVAQTHQAGRMVVVGFGVDHDALVSYAQSLGVSAGEGPAEASVYGGGEIRKDTESPICVVAVAGAGASVGSSDAAALAVAQHILGVGPSVKYGSNASSVLSKAIAGSGGIGMASAVNINYSDSGLFGYFVAADSASAEKVVRAAHAAVKGLKVTDSDIGNGKTRVKAAILMASESGGEALADMGLQTLLLGKYNDPVAAAAAVDAVTPSAVEAALRKVFSGKLSMSVLGNTATIPYLDQL